MTGAAKKALAAREQLREERAAAREARVAHGARGEQLRSELKSLARERKAALHREARTGKAANAAELDRQEAELRADLEREVQAARAAGQAGMAAERELVILHHDRFGDFAAAAEELTREAAAKLDALRADYEDAHRAIELARAEWGLLVKDHQRVLLGRCSPADRSAGLVKRRSLSPPPANPLSPPSEVFDTAIRPVEVEPIEEAAA